MSSRQHTLTGRRLPDLIEGNLPPDLQAGDYWKILNEDGTPRKVLRTGKLTEDTWYVVAPIGDADGFALGRLDHHTVREHEDGTISVRAGDGSSNSILITGSHGRSWHGYIEHGVWRAC
jgi:hypothetical protein